MTKPRDESNPQPVTRGPGGKFAPGFSGHPGGRSAWLKQIRSVLQTSADAGAELLEDVIRGKPLEAEIDGQKIRVTPTVENRLKATEIVLAYSVPKPQPTAALEAEDNDTTLTNVPTEDLEEIEAILSRSKPH